MLPTILELCGVARNTAHPRMDGRTLAPLLRGETGAWTDRTLFTQWHRGDAPELFRDCAARTQQYKLVNGRELFDLTADPGEKNDIASSLPAVAATLRRETEAWFHDVSATRGYAPPRIHVGAPQEPLTVLTRQDWRGPGASWDATGIGHWEVQVARAARYEIHLRMPAVPSPGKASVRIGANSVEADLRLGAATARFPPMHLDPGPARVEASLESAGRAWGPHYVDIRAR